MGVTDPGTGRGANEIRSRSRRLRLLLQATARAKLVHRHPLARNPGVKTCLPARKPPFRPSPVVLKPTLGTPAVLNFSEIPAIPCLTNCPSSLIL